MENEVNLEHEVLLNNEEIAFIIKCILASEDELTGTSFWNNEDDKMLNFIIDKLRKLKDGK